MLNAETYEGQPTVCAYTRPVFLTYASNNYDVSKAPLFNPEPLRPWGKYLYASPFRSANLGSDLGRRYYQNKQISGSRVEMERKPLPYSEEILVANDLRVSLSGCNAVFHVQYR